MRSIQTIRDAEIAIKQLQDRIAYYDSKQWDLGRRNIKNVHPSIDDYDVVVRKELKDLRGAPAEEVTVEGDGTLSGIPNITFCIDGVVPEATNLTPPALINGAGVVSLKPSFIYARCFTPPFSDFKCEIYHNPHPTGTKTLITNGQFTILAGELFATSTDINTAVTFNHLDWASLDTKAAIDIADLEIVIAMRFV